MARTRFYKIRNLSDRTLVRHIKDRLLSNRSLTWNLRWIYLRSSDEFTWNELRRFCLKTKNELMAELRYRRKK